MCVTNRDGSFDSSSTCLEGVDGSSDAWLHEAVRLPDVPKLEAVSSTAIKLSGSMRPQT